MSRMKQSFPRGASATKIYRLRFDKEQSEIPAEAYNEVESRCFDDNLICHRSCTTATVPCRDRRTPSNNVKTIDRVSHKPKERRRSLGCRVPNQRQYRSTGSVPSCRRHFAVQQFQRNYHRNRGFLLTPLQPLEQKPDLNPPPQMYII